MPVRLRITVLFTLLVFLILGLVCISVYYFSHTSRINTIKQRLTNRAVSTAKFLSYTGFFGTELVKRIDSLTTISLKGKAVKAYDYKNKPIYSYSDHPGDTLSVDEAVLDEARINGSVYFTIGQKEAVAYHYVDKSLRTVIIAAAEDEEGKKNLQQLFSILLLSFLGGLVAAFTGGYFFSKRLLQPVKKIADEVNEISAHSFAQRIAGGRSKDEWNYLAGTINNLLDRLQESFDVQKRFISNASHELSTPLTSISSQLEVSLQRERPAEEYRKVMQSISQDVRQMGRLTQTLLEFAKASGTSGGIEILPVRMDEVLLRLPSEISKLNKQYTVALEFESLPEEEDALVIIGNETLLFTAIKNIVVNACKFSDDHKAGVVLSVTGKEIKINVQDTGPGIAADEKEKIFQPFYRAGESRTTEGFGLGLALAERIIKLHKGRISLDSAPGRGTNFIITLSSA